eukprot:TRINITY_DN490_c0_g1_i1.p1 TRINITY_DN490_c0_g1~~TRINITY_DN490_c0_g1_i1.p1  ORF type:complete len:288 (+),score=109.67 TRINITY_DN490_c0_g1_i1:230-1093(+)
MQDRLKELQAKKGYAQFDDGDIEMGQFMTSFFEDVDFIKAGFTKVQDLLDQLQEKQLASVASVSNDETTKYGREIERMTDQITKISADLKNRLKKMKNEVDQMEDSQSTEKRLRTNMHGTLTRKFMDLMKEFQEIQARYKAKFRERVERQVKIVAPEATQDEIEKIMDGGGSDVFSQTILSKKASDAAEALDYVKQRNNEIQNLEKSIMELHGLFVDMQLMVETQGEMLDQIEYSVEQSAVYVEEGADDLTQAVVYANSARKKICLIIVLGLCCLAVIVIPLVIKFK